MSVKDLQIIEEHIENLNRVIEFIEQNIGNLFTLADLAKQARMSFWHFQKVFHILIGEPVKSYVRRRRLTHVSNLLIDSKTSLDVLARIAGFKSQEAFTRAFKEQFSQTPGAFRRAGHYSKLPNARASINRDYLETIFSQVTPPAIDLVELPERHLYGVEDTFFSCFSETADGPKVIPTFWEKLRSCMEKNHVSSCLSYWGLIFEAASANLGEFTYAATFESSQIDNQRLIDFKVYTLQKGLYATFKQQNPPYKIGHNLNYAICVWLNKNNFTFDDRAEFENYSLNYSSSNLNEYFTYGIPIRPK